MRQNFYVDKDGNKKIVIPEKDYNILVVGIGHGHAVPMTEAINKQSKTFHILGYVIADILNDDGIVHSVEDVSKKNMDYFESFQQIEWTELLNGSKNGNEYTFTSKGKVCRVDGILIEATMPYILPCAKRCYDLMGVPIHMDKPPTVDKVEYANFVANMKKDKIPFQIGYVLRTAQSVFVIKNMIEKGYVGDITRLETRMNTDLSKASRSNVSKYPNGAMYLYGCHLLDFILQIMGMPETTYSFKTKSGYDCVDGYDNSFAVLQYPKCIATIEVNQVDANGYAERYISIIGERGKLVLDPLEGGTEIKFYKRIGKGASDNSQNYKSLPLSKPDYSVINPDDHDKYQYPNGRYYYLARNFAFLINNYKAKDDEERYECLLDIDYEYEISLHNLLMKLCE